MDYITITGVKHFFGIEEFQVGETLILEKEEDNNYDDEAIRVLNEEGMVLGYVANSVFSVARGTQSAGRIYDKFEDLCQVSVCFIIGNSVIAQLEKETKNR